MSKFENGEILTTTVSNMNGDKIDITVIFIEYLDEPKIYTKPDGSITTLDCIVESEGIMVMDSLSSLVAI